MASCRDATQQPLKAVFHNRWNVFAGAEDHVTWEIMPARTHSGAIVDLWSQQPVSWKQPPKAARSGRLALLPDARRRRGARRRSGKSLRVVLPRASACRTCSTRVRARCAELDARFFARCRRAVACARLLEASVGPLERRSRKRFAVLFLIVGMLMIAFGRRRASRGSSARGRTSSASRNMRRACGRRNVERASGKFNCVIELSADC